MGKKLEDGRYLIKNSEEVMRFSEPPKIMEKEDKDDDKDAAKGV